MKPYVSLLLALAALVPACALAQSPEAFKERLAQPAIHAESGRTAVVTLHEEPEAAEALRLSQPQSTRLQFKGWRVCIFSDNTAEARAGALAAIKTAEEQFPDIPIYDSYASPYFRVSAGNCTSTEEAIILLERVRPHFPKAFVKQEQLSIADLLK